MNQDLVVFWFTMRNNYLQLPYNIVQILSISSTTFVQQLVFNSLAYPYPSPSPSPFPFYTKKPIKIERKIRTNSCPYLDYLADDHMGQ